MTNHKLSFLSLSDDDFMLALCVRPEDLTDPKRWCREMRENFRARQEGPKTSAEADALFAAMDRLRKEANGE